MRLTTSPVVALRITVSLLAAAGLAGCAARIPAKDAAMARPAGTSATAQARSLEAVSLAADLAALGFRTNSALALTTAAQLLLDNPVAPLAVTPEATQQGAAGAPKGGTEPTLDISRLLTAAQSMGRDNAHISGLVTQLQQRQAAGSRGATYGARADYYSVPANGTHTFRITFDGGDYAGVAIEGDGDTDLDCYVYDSDNRLVAYDNDYTDICILEWTPSSTNQHRIEVKNLGDVYNRYYFVTN